MTEAERWQTVPRDHPALPGHFPGRPVVPGVVLLSYVGDALRARLGTAVHCSAWPAVKFLAPLLPGEAFAVAFDLCAPGSAKFTVRTAERTIAQGSLRYVVEDAR